MVETFRGRLVNVLDQAIGSALDGDHADAVTELVVLDASSFDEDGGTLSLNGVEYSYTGIDDDTSTVFLADPLTDAAADGDDVLVAPSVREKVAVVAIEGSGDIEIRVPSIWYPMLAASIRDPQTEVAVTMLRVGDDWLLIDARGTAKQIDAETIVGEIPNEPTEAPSEAPDIDVAPFAIGSVSASWDPVARARWYEVAASLTTPVPTDGSATVATQTGTRAAIDTADGDIIPAGPDAPPVYVTVRAVNSVGAGPWSTEVSAMARQADVAQLNVAQLNALSAEVFQAYIANLSTDIVTTSGRIIVGDEQAAHIIIDPADGLTLYAADGQTVLVRLDMTDQQLSEFTGRINASQVSVLNGLELRGILSRMVSSALLTLSSGGVENPSQAPLLTADVETENWPALPSGYEEYGLDYDGTNWYRLIWNNTSTNTCRIQTINSAGEVTNTLQLRNLVQRNDGGDVGVDAPSGLAFQDHNVLGPVFYVMRRRKAGSVGNREWMLCAYGDSGDPVEAYAGRPVGREASDGSAGEYPTLGISGTAVIVGSLSDTFFFQDVPTVDPGGSPGGFATYGTSIHTTLGYLWYAGYAFADGAIGAGLRGRGCGIHNFSEYGGDRFWIANNTRVYIFEIDGEDLLEDADHIDPSTGTSTWDLDGSQAQVTHGGTYFHSSSSTGRKKYSNYVKGTAASRRWWARYQWELGSDATAPSPIESLIVPDRRWLNVGLALPTDGTDATRVFTGLGDTEPANTAMYDRGTTDGTSYRLSTVATSGDNPNTVSDFPDSGDPASIMSQGGGFEVHGDGTGEWPLLDLSDRFQCGENILIPSGSGGVNVNVTFATPFRSEPSIGMSVSHPNITHWRRTSKSPTDATFRFDRSGGATYYFDWQGMAS